MVCEISTQIAIYVRDYTDAKIGCVPVACHLLCHCTVVASFGLRNRDIHDFSDCVMSDTDKEYYCKYW